MADDDSAGPLSPNAFAMGRKPPERMEADPWWGHELPSELLDPDDRWQNFIVGTRSDLEAVASEWHQGGQVPDQVTRMLRVSRELFTHSYFVHEFAVAAVVWSLLAVEASFRDVVGINDRAPFAALIGKAHERRLLSDNQRELLDYARQMRNTLVHSRDQKAFSVGMSASVLQTAHAAVADLYENVPGESTPRF